MDFNTLRCVDGPTGGTFTLSVGASSSDPIPFDADSETCSVAAQQAAMREQARLDAGGLPYVFTPTVFPCFVPWYRRLGWTLRRWGWAAQHGWRHFWRSQQGLETVEWAIVAGGIVMLATIVAVLVIGLWAKVQERILGGKLDWDPGPGYSGEK